jgi:hypothetical protein
MAPHQVELVESEQNDNVSTTMPPNKSNPIDSILKVKGAEIVDGHGNSIVLKGVSSPIV